MDQSLEATLARYTLVKREHLGRFSVRFGALLKEHYLPVQISFLDRRFGAASIFWFFETSLLSGRVS